MADTTSYVVKRLGLADPAQAQQLAAKAQEYVRVSTARLGAGGLGQGELAKSAACVELAAWTLGVRVDAALVQRHSSCSDKVYRGAKAALQKILNVGTKASARDLCIQFGCARHEPSVRAALAAFKERFVASLPSVQQGHVDFGRPVFLAAAFYLVARKNRVAVDRMKLLGPLGITATEFAQVCTSMADLCHDLVGVEPRKRKAEDLPEGQRALVERTGAAADDFEQASDSEDEVEDEGQVGHRLNPKKQRQREYEAWKEKVTQESAAEKQARKKQAGCLTEKKLKQAVLSFAAGASAPPAADAAAPAADAAAGGGSGGSAKAAAQAAGAAAAKQQAGKGRSGSGAGKQKAALAAKNS